MSLSLQLLLLTLSHIFQALTSAHLQVQYPKFNVSKHAIEYSYFCHITSCSYHQDY